MLIKLILLIAQNQKNIEKYYGTSIVKQSIPALLKDCEWWKFPFLYQSIHRSWKRRLFLNNRVSQHQQKFNSKLPLCLKLNNGDCKKNYAIDNGQRTGKRFDVTCVGI